MTAVATYWRWTHQPIARTLDIEPGTLTIDLDQHGRIVGIETIGRSLTDTDAWTILHTVTLADVAT